MNFKQAERMILDDGWAFDYAVGSHYHYKHPTKPGKVTIPFHKGDLPPKTIKSIRKQAGLE